jgi:hypothetical protein
MQVSLEIPDRIAAKLAALPDPQQFVIGLLTHPWKGPERRPMVAALRRDRFGGGGHQRQRSRRAPRPLPRHPVDARGVRRRRGAGRPRQQAGRLARAGRRGEPPAHARRVSFRHHGRGCISILVATDLGIVQAFTTDRHFTQAGLAILLEDCVRAEVGTEVEAGQLGRFLRIWSKLEGRDNLRTSRERRNGRELRTKSAKHHKNSM